MSLTIAYLDAVLATVFAGNRRAMARAFKMNVRNLQRMLGGTRDIPPSLCRDVARLIDDEIARASDDRARDLRKLSAGLPHRS